MNGKEDRIVKPLDFVNLQLNSLTPVQLDHFWASDKNKECISSLAKDRNLNMGLSGFDTDVNEAELCIQYNNGAQTLIRIRFKHRRSRYKNNTSYS